MIREKLKGLVLDIHDSVDEMGILRFQEYNRCLLIDASIGSDASDINDHYHKLVLLAKHNQSDDLITELTNYQQNLMNIVTKTSPKMRTFVTLIDKVNGKKFTDLSPNGVDEMLIRLDRGGATISFIDRILDLVKKK